MEGILLINKNINITSRDVVNELNHLFNIKRIGHTGTLDPIATGVLVCCIGKYTKLVNIITSLDKEYIAEIKLGIKTDTGDITGSIIENSATKVSLQTINEVFTNFPRKYLQTVPKYSAVKINGKKLYEYARNNIEIELPKREVNIYSLELISFENNIIKFKTKVSKGTYIRSLIEDICTNLNTLGTMSSLIRTKQGNFDIKESYTIEDIKNNNYKLLRAQDIFNYPVVEIEESLYKAISNGASIPNLYNIKDIVIFTYNNKEIALYKSYEDKLKAYIML